MNPGERFKAWIDSLALEWKDRLRGWMASWAENAVKSYMDAREPEIIASTQETINKLLAQPNLPPELRHLLEKSVETGDITTVIMGWILTAFGAIPAALGRGAPLGRTLEYVEDTLWESARLDPQSAITAWRRDPVKYAAVFKDLSDQGWNAQRIETLKFITEIIPGVSDLVRMAVREAFSPEIAEKFGQYEDFPEDVVPWGEKQGLTRDWLRRYWAAHWELPGATQGIEMFRRTTTSPTKFSGSSIGSVGGQPIYRVVDEENLKLLLRALDIMPPWRDALMQIAYEIPTRVDVRRFWDMRTIDEDRLREVYGELGYHGKDLDDYVLWTKIYTDFPDLLARYKNGWITIDQVKTELVAMGMKPERADTMIQEKMKNATIERTVTEKDLTAADIIKGVLKNVITRAEATTLLVSIGYSTAEAAFKLAIGAPEDEEAKAKAERELTKGDIAASVKEGLITPAEAIPKLVALRYKAADATFLSKLYAAQIPIAKVEPERDLTRGDITSALKAGIILPAKARLMLAALRYSAEEIEFLVTANTPAPEAIKVEEPRQVPKTDILTALIIGTITDAEAVTRLVGLGYTPEAAAFQVALERRVTELKAVTKPKEESRADVTTAVKKGLITPEEGYLMLLNLDFSPDAAMFILSVVAEESPFSPMNYTEFQDIASKWRLAAGLGGVPMPEEIKRLGAEVVRLSAEVSAIEGSIKAEKSGLLETEGLPATATARLKELQATLYKAQAELARVKTDYNAKVAEWRHGAT